MKTSRTKILEANRTLFTKIVADIRSGDPAALMADRAGSRLTVTPDDPPNPDEQTTVIVMLDSVMAVTKGANLNEIIALLSMVPDGAFAALGTSLKGAMAAGAGLAEASVATLNRIMATQQSQDNLKLLIPITDIPQTSPPIKLKVDATVEGWTRTNDWDGDEIANFTYHAELLSDAGNKVETTNLGTERQVPIDSTISTITKPIAATETIVAVDLGWNLSTDGAFTHDSISLVQLSSLSVTLTYV